ncbi:MAG: cofactor-independent phosphoglycerate mutase [Chloroflexi bacterium]|jgi:2,3-bisphosphoglycerate-independent phosphoglycerate mutase|nr:cofactor-independent phosphoglycerate mutase [Chloroflexota bacterium]
MKYFVLIPDGAAGWPLEGHGDQTCLELARTPNLDAMAREGQVGLTRTVPDGMEPSSACACMSIMGYDPKTYYSGRGPIEAKSMGLELTDGEVAFRCNTIAVRDGTMWSFNAGHISDSESHQIVESLNRELGNERIRFHLGVGYRHICTVKDGEASLGAICTPPHDISDQPIAEFLPHGPGSQLLLDLMEGSKPILEKHPVNLERQSQGKIPASMIWLFWGGKRVPDFPSFKQRFGVNAAMTSGVGLLEGLAGLTDVAILKIPGVTDNIDNDYEAQGEGALKALEEYDLVFVHIEAPDESGHEGLIDEKVKSIEQIDEHIISRLRSSNEGDLRVLIMPDHPTPIEIKTHVPDPVPFVLWGPGFDSNGAESFSEQSGKETNLYIEHGYNLIDMLTKR